MLMDINIVDGNSVYAQRSQEPCVIPDPAFVGYEPVIPEEYGIPRISSFNTPVHVVPVVYHAYPRRRVLCEVKAVDAQAHLHAAQKLKGAVQDAPVCFPAIRIPSRRPL